MRYAHIKDGVCINVIEIKNEKALEKMKKILCKNGEELIMENIKIGSAFDGENWVDKENEITLEEIDSMVVKKIRERYDVNEEYKMLRLGVLNKKNPLFVEYNKYVEECRVWGESEKERIGTNND